MLSNLRTRQCPINITRRYQAWPYPHSRLANYTNQPYHVVFLAWSFSEMGGSPSWLVFHSSFLPSRGGVGRLPGAELKGRSSALEGKRGGTFHLPAGEGRVRWLMVQGGLTSTPPPPKKKLPWKHNLPLFYARIR